MVWPDVDPEAEWPELPRIAFALTMLKDVEVLGCGWFTEVLLLETLLLLLWEAMLPLVFCISLETELSRSSLVLRCTDPLPSRLL